MKTSKQLFFLLALCSSITKLHTQVNTISNVGTGSEIYQGMDGASNDNANLRTINAGMNISVVQNTDTVDLSVTGSNVILTSSFDSGDITSVDFSLTQFDKLVVMHIPAFSCLLTADTNVLNANSTLDASMYPAQEINMPIMCNVNGARYFTSAKISTSGVISLYITADDFSLWLTDTPIDFYPSTVSWMTA